MTETPVLLIAAISARGMAMAARRAGFAVIALDAFGDLDTRAACREAVVLENAVGGFAEVDLEAVVARACVHQPIGLVYGSGFDDCPERLASVAKSTPIFGTSPAALARAKNPRVFASACAAAALAHPEIAYETRSGWLVKRQGGSGGGHIRERASALRDGEYSQRRIEGRSVSLLFTGDFDTVTPIAWSEQWTAPCVEAPFRYGGAAGPIPGAQELIPALTALSRALGVRGLASADFLDDGERFWLLEINPRPGATLDVFDDDEDPLMARHLAASAGLTALPPKPRSPKASEIVYADADLAIRRVDWPDWAADRPAPGTSISRGSPICTVSAAGPDVAAAKAEAHARAERMRSELQEGGP